MLSKVQLVSGRPGDAPGALIVPATLTVVIGPNNSGKSQFLRDLRSAIQNGGRPPAGPVVSEIEVASYSNVEAQAYVRQLEVDRVNEGGREILAFGSLHDRRTISRHELEQLLSNLPQNQAQVLDVLRHQVLWADGSQRLELVRDQPGGDLQQPPQNSLQRLFRDDERRQKLRNSVHRAIGYWPVIDPTHLGQLRVRLSKELPASNSVERGLDRESIDFHAQAVPVHHFSDGVRALVGLLIAAVAEAPSVMLLDEPEAFLHPSVARRLGSELGELARGTNKQLFVATHSSSFLLGAIQSGVQVGVVRLTWDGTSGTARTLSPDQVLELSRQPLLRSSGALEGLFYDSVVVSESDADRAFYEEANVRLQRAGRGIPDCLFLNAQNLQTVPLVVKRLRSLGVPAAGIVDLDLLTGPPDAWAKVCSAAGLTAAETAGLGNVRASIRDHTKSSSLNIKRAGIDGLDGEKKKEASNLVEQLMSHGFFLVPVGELENWLRPLDVSGHGPGWLVSIFDKMKSDPDEQGYLVAGDGDVWAFLERVAGWMHDPVRKGLN